MKRRIIVMIAVLCGVLALSTCDFILPPGQAGEIRFDLGLAQPRQLGYEVTAVRCTLQHQVSGTLVVQDLNVEGESATGLIRGLRTGWWNLTVELLEGEEVIGTATSEVEVLAGQTARVVLQVDLATGDLEIVVNWKNGGMILDLDLGELVGAGYEIAEVEYTLTHNASGQTIGGQVVPDGTTAYAEVPELWIGTWTVEVALWQPGADEPLCTTQYDLDVGPGLIEELNLEVTSLEPVGAILVPYTPTQLYGWPDLTVASFEAPASAAPGEPIGALVSVEVMNDGIGIAPATADDGAFTVSFYLSQFSYHGPFSELLASAEVPTPVAPGETVAVEVPASLSVPEATPTGNFYLIVVVDDDGEVAELSDSNNVASHGLAVRLPATIHGESNVVSVGEQGNYIDISFEASEPLTLIDAQWNWSGRSVYLDVDGVSMVDPENLGVEDYQFHFGPGKASAPAGEIEQVFGFYAEGFDSGDYFKFTMDLDHDLPDPPDPPPPPSGTPSSADLEGGTLTLIFSDGRVVTATFDVPWDDNPWAAKAIIESGF